MIKNLINLEDIYDKNLNFLIGAGASFGLFPTLALNIKTDTGEMATIETLAEKFDKEHKDELKTLLFMYYFQSCIAPVMSFDIATLTESGELAVIENYQKFLETILLCLNKARPFNRRCNIFTTNYDGCFALTADKLLSQGEQVFRINDGTHGFRKKYLHIKNFEEFVCKSGVFDQRHTDVPQINLMHLHGSVYWQREKESIVVDYAKVSDPQLIDVRLQELLKTFSDMVNSKDKTISDLENQFELIENTTQLKKLAKDFWSKYDFLPIVNPTKWKFHETVFEEHYYQMLRALSYELEKPNAILISFGFSFADEHILNLVKRSLSNPKLKLYVCCFDECERRSMAEKFLGHPNVELVSSHSMLTFNEFNSKIFTLVSESLDSEVQT